MIEANALGTPVVARNAPGLRDSIRQGRTGLLIDPIATGNTRRRSESRTAAEAIRYAEGLATLLVDNDEAREMRRTCLAWSKQFDWDRAADDMEASIEETLGKDLP